MAFVKRRLFATPVLGATPVKSPVRTRIVTTPAARRALDLSESPPTPAPTKLTADTAKVGALVAGIDPPRKDDRGMITKISDGTCAVLWSSDGKQEDFSIENLTLAVLPTVAVPPKPTVATGL